MPRYVITGASGGGKSTLLRALADAGHQTVPEVGRQIVQDQMAAGGDALPHSNPVAFSHLLFDRSIQAYDAAPAGTVFFDRSFIEAIAFLRHHTLPIPLLWETLAAERRFTDPVFVVPPWEEIYQTDAERTHDFEFAKADHTANVAAYRAAGYRLINVPPASVADRVRFVAGHLPAAM